MVGVDRLRLVGEELYRERDPTDRLSDGAPFRVEDEGDNVVLVMKVPFVERREVDVLRHGDEFYLTVGTYRRSYVLPDSLRRRQVLRGSAG